MVGQRQNNRPPNNNRLPSNIPQQHIPDIWNQYLINQNESEPEPQPASTLDIHNIISRLERNMLTSLNLMAQTMTSTMITITNRLNTIDGRLNTIDDRLSEMEVAIRYFPHRSEHSEMLGSHFAETMDYLESLVAEDPQ